MGPYCPRVVLCGGGGRAGVPIASRYNIMRGTRGHCRALCHVFILASYGLACAGVVDNLNARRFPQDIHRICTGLLQQNNL